MTSTASTVEEYLARLPDERREAIQQVRRVILDNLPEGYEEQMTYGIIGYVIPHSLYPKGYHCDPKQPLSIAGLASQKNYMVVYLMSVYGDPATEKWFKEEYAKSGKKLDMGKSCVRFKSVDALALDVIGKVIARVTPEAYISRTEEALASRKTKR